VTPVPSIELGAGDGRDNTGFWSALGGQPKPGLDVTVTATADIAPTTRSGPAVDGLTISSRATENAL